MDATFVLFSQQKKHPQLARSFGKYQELSTPKRGDDFQHVPLVIAPKLHPQVH